MKTFVINLDKNTGRMAFMGAQLKRLGMEYERIPAVYGAALTPKERKAYVSSTRAYLVAGRRISDGEIGCALSHDSIYKKMMDENITAAVVFEDDIVIQDGIVKVMSNITQFMNVEKAQVFLLSSFGIKKKLQTGIERIKGGMCTDGYVITLPAAQRIYKANYPVITVADRWVRWEGRFGVEMYRAWPTTVCQDNDRFGTDISVVKFNALKGVRRLIYKVLRAVEVVADWMWYKISGR